MFIFRRKKQQQSLNSRESTYARSLQHENFQACIFHERKKNIQKRVGSQAHDFRWNTCMFKDCVRFVKSLDL